MLMQRRHMSIRRLAPADAHDFRALRLHALQDSPTAFGSSFEEHQDRPLAEAVVMLGVASGHHMFGAFDGASLVGIVGVSREEGAKERHRGCLRSMFVAKSHRGQGLGKALMGAAVTFARTMPGLRQLTLDVTAGNLAAIATYQGFGFKVYGTAPQALFVDGQYHDEVNMVLHLV